MCLVILSESSTLPVCWSHLSAFKYAEGPPVLFIDIFSLAPLPSPLNKRLTACYVDTSVNKGKSPWLYGAYSPGLGQVIPSVVRAVRRSTGSCEGREEG